MSKSNQPSDKQPNKKSGAAQYLHSQQELQRQLRQFTQRHRNWLVFGFLCLALAAYVSLHRTTVLVPYGLDQRVSVGLTQATPYYLTLLARNDAMTYFNATPKTIESASAIFLTRLQPQLYGDLQAPLLKRAQDYRRDNQTTVFFPIAGARVEGETVTLQGNLVTLIGDKTVRHQTLTVKVVYQSFHGLRYIAAWNYE